ncbi:DUF4190 domain-containing protein [Actinoplanes sp. NPDC051513]|uniref:DUF4190 domain-containing protein n=1 Tax=Actinoplanes sp. NPDC051513 TaxID=3363908 RepID=UPI0037A59435
MSRPAPSPGDAEPDDRTVRRFTPGVVPARTPPADPTSQLGPGEPLDPTRTFGPEDGPPPVDPTRRFEEAAQLPPTSVDLPYSAPPVSAQPAPLPPAYPAPVPPQSPYAPPAAFAPPAGYAPADPYAPPAGYAPADPYAPPAAAYAPPGPYAPPVQAYSPPAGPPQPPAAAFAPPPPGYAPPPPPGYAPPGYGPPGAYPPPQPYQQVVMAVAAPTSGWAVASLVLGIIGLLGGWCAFGIPCLLAVVLGHIGYHETKRGAKSGKGLAVAGLVMGYICVVPGVLFTLWVIGAGTYGASFS